MPSHTRQSSAPAPRGDHRTRLPNLPAVGERLSRTPMLATVERHPIHLRSQLPPEGSPSQIQLYHIQSDPRGLQVTASRRLGGSPRMHFPRAPRVRAEAQVARGPRREPSVLPPGLRFARAPLIHPRVPISGVDPVVLLRARGNARGSVSRSHRSSP